MICLQTDLCFEIEISNRYIHREEFSVWQQDHSTTSMAEILPIESFVYSQTVSLLCLFVILCLRSAVHSAGDWCSTHLGTHHHGDSFIMRTRTFVAFATIFTTSIVESMHLHGTSHYILIKMLKNKIRVKTIVSFEAFK